MKILLLGSGGREHALAWKIAQSPKVEKLYIAPGNAGTTAVGENVNIKATDFEAISAFALKENIQMIVVGPEDPLVKGIYDYFQKSRQEEMKEIREEELKVKEIDREKYYQMVKQRKEKAEERFRKNGHRRY